MNAPSRFDAALSRQVDLHARITAAAANKIIENIQHWPDHVTIAVLREIGAQVSSSSASDAAYDAADRLEADTRSVPDTSPVRDPSIALEEWRAGR